MSIGKKSCSFLWRMPAVDWAHRMYDTTSGQIKTSAQPKHGIIMEIVNGMLVAIECKTHISSVCMLSALLGTIVQMSCQSGSAIGVDEG